MLETVIASSVLIGIVVLLRRLFKGRIDPRLQYALWLLVAARLIMPFPIVDSPVSVLNVVDAGKHALHVGNPALTLPNSAQETGVISPEGLGDVTSEPGVIRDTVPGKTVDSDTAHGLVTVTGVLHAVWLFGAFTTGFQFVLQNIQFHAGLRRTRERASIPDSRLLVYFSSHVKSPCLFGIRPAIYLPLAAPTRSETLKYIVVHEETHYRHGDHLWSFLRCLCLTLHWFNPLVWWAAVLSRRDCEMACDQSALNRIGGEHRKAYGNTLIDMIELRTRPSDLLLSATTMTSSPSGIRERITMIAKKPKMLLSTLLIMLLFLAVAVGCTFTGANEDSSADMPYPIPTDGRQWGQSFSGFTSATDGWFVGSPGAALGSSRNYVYLTGDGGKTWKETGNINDEWPRVLTCASFADHSIGYLCFRYDTENIGRVYQTIDGGKTWTRHEIPEFAMLAEDGAGEARSLEFDADGNGKMEFFFRNSPSEEHEGATQVLVSRDKGLTWARPGESFSASTGNIHDYMPLLLADETVSDYELLPCLEKFTRATWLELERTYGGDRPDAPPRPWFDALWVALRDAAVSHDQTESDDQIRRYYYIGKAYLTSDSAYSEGLSDIVMEQWSNNSTLYSTCLNQLFSAQESANLRRAIMYTIGYWHLGPAGLSGPGIEGSIYLGAYPVDFPFGYDLTEKSRETFRAESFGQVTVVESDGLQVTYLNPADGVYTVITLRANKERYEAAGVAIGDSEQSLAADWPHDLRKVERISHDDEAWFGSGYDYAYAYTPEDSTKSVVFLVTDGLISGIGIVNGLDGSMY